MGGFYFNFFFEDFTLNIFWSETPGTVKKSENMRDTILAQTEKNIFFLKHFCDKQKSMIFHKICFKKNIFFETFLCQKHFLF